MLSPGEELIEEVLTSILLELQQFKEKKYYTAVRGVIPEIFQISRELQEKIQEKLLTLDKKEFEKFVAIFNKKWSEEIEKIGHVKPRSAGIFITIVTEKLCFLCPERRTCDSPWKQ